MRASQHENVLAEDLDKARGLFAALSLSPTAEFRPIHPNRFASVLERYGLSIDCGVVLELLEALREVQRLPGGYWVPTPTRLVELADHPLILSTASTHELTRSGFEVRATCGFGRLLVGGTTHCAVQTFDDWIGSDPNLEARARNAVIAAKLALKPTVHPEGEVEVYAPWLARQHGSTSRKRWIDIGKAAPAVNDELFLCRAGSNFNKRHFWARIGGARVLAEAPTTSNVLRLMYGLDLWRGEVKTIAGRRDGPLITLRLIPLPVEERRFVLATSLIGKPDNVEFATFHESLYPEMKTFFSRFGAQLRLDN